MCSVTLSTLTLLSFFLSLRHVHSNLSLELNFGELWVFKPDCSDMAAFKISRRNYSVTVVTFYFQSRDQLFEKFVIIVNTLELYFWKFWAFISDWFYFLSKFKCSCLSHLISRPLQHVEFTKPKKNLEL